MELFIARSSVQKDASRSELPSAGFAWPAQSLATLSHLRVDSVSRNTNALEWLLRVARSYHGADAEQRHLPWQIQRSKQSVRLPSRAIARFLFAGGAGSAPEGTERHMPKNKAQGFIYGIIMSIAMAYGMEVYNVAWKLGIPTMAGGFSNMTNDVFAEAFVEASYMWILVFLFSNLWGTRGGASLAKRLIDPERDSAFVQGTIRSCCTVLIMCPTMSLVASVLFNIILAGMPVSQLPGIWVGTLIKNFPMALLWNLFAASPVTRLVFGALFSNVGEVRVVKEAEA